MARCQLNDSTTEYILYTHIFIGIHALVDSGILQAPVHDKTLRMCPELVVVTPIFTPLGSVRFGTTDLGNSSGKARHDSLAPRSPTHSHRAQEEAKDALPQIRSPVKRARTPPTYLRLIIRKKYSISRLVLRLIVRVWERAATWPPASRRLPEAGLSSSEAPDRLCTMHSSSSRLECPPWTRC